MKKILAVIFIVVGALLCLSLLGQIPKLIGTTIRGVSSGNGNELGYMIGTFLSFGIFAALAYFSIKYGIKWLRNPRSSKKTEDVLDDHLMTNHHNDDQLK